LTRTVADKHRRQAIGGPGLPGPAVGTGRGRPGAHVGARPEVRHEHVCRPAAGQPAARAFVEPALAPAGAAGVHPYSLAYLDRSNDSIGVAGGLKHDLGLTPGWSALLGALFFASGE
jgi:hypothetical protein